MRIFTCCKSVESRERKGQARICVVGAGRWGRNHLRTLHELGVLAGVVEVDAARRVEVQAEYGVGVFSDVPSAMAAGFDGYVVAVPAAQHVVVALPLLRAGSAVLVEKPMALSVVEATRLLEASKRYGARLMVGHLLLFHSAIRKIKEIIDRGVLGRLVYLYSNRLNFGKVRSEENAFWSLAPHDISVFNYLLGGQPTGVAAQGRAFLRSGIEDEVHATLRYPGGEEAHIFASWLHPFKEHRLVVVGSEGMVVYEDSSESKEVLLYQKGFKAKGEETESFDGGVATIPYEHTLPLTEELRYFVAHLEDGYSVASGAEGAEVIKVLERVSEQLKR